jgi:hypothetical protein
MMMAKAARTVTMEGRVWSPLTPISFAFSGNQIVVEHFVPYPPLVLDYDWVTDPGNSGYSYTDNVDPTITIANVAVTSPTAVTITLNQATTGGMLGYANFAPPSDPSYNAGGGGSTMNYCATGGPRGCLRDSDPAVAYYVNPSIDYYIPSVGGPNQYPMQNYCVAYQQQVGACISAQGDKSGPLRPEHSTPIMPFARQHAEVNRGMIYLGACLLRAYGWPGSSQVTVRVIPTGYAIDESVDLAREIFNRVFRRIAGEDRAEVGKVTRRIVGDLDTSPIVCIALCLMGSIDFALDI